MLEDGRWIVEPTCTARAVARVVGIPVRCAFDICSAEAEIADSGHTGSIRVALDATSFRSGNRRRDGHVASSDFLAVADHPTITFEASWVDLTAPPIEVVGELRVCDRPASVTVRIDVHPTGHGAVEFRARARISRRAVGVARARWVLHDLVDVEAVGVALRHGPPPVDSDAAQPDAANQPGGAIVHG